MCINGTALLSQVIEIRDKLSRMFVASHFITGTLFYFVDDHGFKMLMRGIVCTIFEHTHIHRYTNTYINNIPLVKNTIY